MVIARRRRRWGLYVPYILLLVLALAWSAFWFIGRDRAAATLDRAIAREADASGHAPTARSPAFRFASR
jgi:hypothetical protein